MREMVSCSTCPSRFSFSRSSASASSRLSASCASYSRAACASCSPQRACAPMETADTPHATTDHPSHSRYGFQRASARASSSRTACCSHAPLTACTTLGDSRRITCNCDDQAHIYCGIWQPALQPPNDSSKGSILAPEGCGWGHCQKSAVRNAVQVDKARVEALQECGEPRPAAGSAVADSVVLAGLRSEPTHEKRCQICSAMTSHCSDEIGMLSSGERRGLRSTMKEPES